MSYKIVEVEWEDITHLNRSMDIKEIDSHGLLSFKNIGYLIKEDENLMVLCSSYVLGVDNEKYTTEDSFRDILIIPKRMIKNIKR